MFCDLGSGSCVKAPPPTLTVARHPARMWPRQPRLLDDSMLHPFQEQVRLAVKGNADHLSFRASTLNIVDPLAPWNNLGRSVDRRGLVAIKLALRVGRERFFELLR